MATLEELMNLYRSDIPDYLQEKPKASLKRSPAQAVESIKKTTEVTEPQIETPLKRLEARRAELEKTEPALRQAMESAYQRYGQRLSGGAPGGAAQPEVSFSADTLQKIKEAEESFLSKLQGYEPPKKESDVLAQALIGLLPSVIGTGVGALSGLPGGAYAGLAAGGAAGVKGIETLTEAEKATAKQAQERYLKQVGAETEIFKKKIETLTEPELLQMKSVLNFSMAASEEKARQAIAKGLALNLGKEQLENLPEVRQYRAYEENLKKINDKITEVQGTPATQRTTRAVEVTPQAEGTLGFGFKLKPTASKKDADKAKEIVSKYGQFRTAADEAINVLKQDVWNLPYSKLNDVQKQKLAEVFNNYTKNLYNFGAALTDSEIALAEKAVPRTLSGMELVRHVFNNKSLVNRLVSLNDSVFKSTAAQLLPYQASYVGMGAPKAPAAAAKAPSVAPKASASDLEAKRKRLEEIQRKLKGQ